MSSDMVSDNGRKYATSTKIKNGRFIFQYFVLNGHSCFNYDDLKNFKAKNILCNRKTSRDPGEGCDFFY